MRSEYVSSAPSSTGYSALTVFFYYRPQLLLKCLLPLFFFCLSSSNHSLLAPSEQSWQLCYKQPWNTALCLLDVVVIFNLAHTFIMTSFKNLLYLAISVLFRSCLIHRCHGSEINQIWYPLNTQSIFHACYQDQVQKYSRNPQRQITENQRGSRVLLTSGVPSPFEINPQ